MLRSMNCPVCSKSVGWAESVSRDGNVFHRGCFKCAGCSKRLDRGAGLRDQGKYYCRHCHSKNFGPMGFNKGVVVKANVMTRVATNVQPVFAHVSTKAVADVKAEKDKLYEFDVALFDGKTIDELKNYIAEGKVDTSSWTEETFKDLLDHTRTGKCELGLTPDGNALRVVSVAKVFVYDSNNDLILINPLCSKEDDDFVTGRREAMKVDAANLQKAVGASKGDLKPEGNMYAAVAALMDLRKHPKQENESNSQNVRIPGDLVFQTTYSPFKETARDAGARVFSWRFNLTDVTGRIFQKVVPRTIKTQDSVHYPGLKTEYHTHCLMLKPEFVTPLQKSLPVDSVTPVGLDEITNSGINVHWYVWLGKSNNAKQMAGQLGDLYEASQKVKSLVGEIDQERTLAFGELLVEEVSLMSQFKL